VLVAVVTGGALIVGAVAVTVNVLFVDGALLVSTVLTRADAVVETTAAGASTGATTADEGAIGAPLMSGVAGETAAFVLLFSDAAVGGAGGELF